MRGVTVAQVVVACLEGAACGCHADVPLDEPGDAASGDDGPRIVVPDAATCTVDGQCIQSCPAGSSTSISGTVYDPAGNNPLYDIAVYVPSSLPLPARPGPPAAPVTCYQCADYYPKDVVVGDLTDSMGHFQLVDVPVGTSVPLVVQIGKWRTVTRVSTTACRDAPVPDKSLRLPSKASQTDTLPEIAISTGGADSLECLLRRVGVDPAEYTSGAGGGGRVHVFQGGGGINPAGPATQGGSPPSATALWPTSADLQRYDIVMLSCEGGETDGMNPSALDDYVNVGGRVFASHFHYAWFTSPTSPLFNANLATWYPSAQDIGDINATILQAGFYGGMVMHDWLANTGALVNDELHIVQARHNADVGPSNMASRPWIVADADAGTPPGSAAGATQYFSFETPVGASIEKLCGRVVYSDLHVGAASMDYGVAPGGNTTGGVVPSGCANNALSPQEKALEYMLFDLAACFTPSDRKPSSTWTK